MLSTVNLHPYTVRCPTMLMPAGNDPDNIKPGGVNVEAMVSGLGEENVRCVEFADMKHGFMARADVKTEEGRRDVERAMRLIKEWFARHVR